MVLLSSVTGAVMAAVLIQLALLMLEPHYGLQLLHWKNVICSKSVLLVCAATSAVVFLVCVQYERHSVLETVRYAILLWGLAVLSVIDHKRKLVPNKLLFVLFALWALTAAVSMLQNIEAGIILLIESAMGAGIAGVIFGACYLISRKQLGAGDVKLAIVMGLFLAGGAIQAYLCGSVLCCLYCIVQLLRKKLGWKDSIPMVPFLTAGTWITLLFIK